MSYRSFENVRIEYQNNNLNENLQGKTNGHIKNRAQEYSSLKYYKKFKKFKIVTLNSLA
jgi:hypothetical protein